MKTMKLGSSNVDASVVGLGCMRMANKTVHEAEAVLEEATTAGINFFDHADIYGGGKSEEIFASVLKNKTTLREEMIIQSKVGIRDGMYDFSADYIIDSVDNILKRLNTEYIDVLLLHRPDALVEPEEVASAFSLLHEKGKVKHFGVSNHHYMQIQLLESMVDQPLIVNQLQFGLMHTPLIDAGLRMNMTDEKANSGEAGTLDYCRLKQMTIQAWSPFMFGFFEGNFIDNERFPALNQLLDRLAKKYDVNKATIAIAWILRHPAKIQPIIGTMTPKRISQIAKASTITLTRKDWYELYIAAGNSLP